MTYKTLLAIHGSHEPLASLKPAIAMADRLQAHLEIRVLSTSTISTVPNMAMSTDHSYTWSEDLSELVGDTNKRVKAVKTWLEDQNIDAVVTSNSHPLARINDTVSEPALYADLVLYNRTADSIVVGDMAKALDGAIFDAGKPALIFTDSAVSSNAEFKNVSIAWDPVPEAMKALTTSVPILKNADNIELLIITQNSEEETYSTQTKKIMGWLRRHELKAVLTLVPQNDLSVSEALIEYIKGAQRDLVVMGAYGHSRFSERLFSGVSYKMLDQSKTPLFIAH